eukprot:6172564-Pyramimonas_sp.AAC.1
MDHVHSEFAAHMQSEKMAGRPSPEAGKAGYETKCAEWLSETRLARAPRDRLFDRSSVRRRGGG